MSVTVVVPTVGRPSLHVALKHVVGRLPVIVVDDRVQGRCLAVPEGVTVLRSWGRGPAAARNVGWAACTTEWVAFLDDDVDPPGDWAERLLVDLVTAAPDVGGVQGGVIVPTGRQPTDWERSTKRLETSVWATADLAYRRAALCRVGGFDERFPRAYREDADLGLRVTGAGYRIVRGEHWVTHPVRPVRWSQSIRSQRGNADDVLMRAVHGRRWRDRAQVPAGRRPWHLLTTALLVAGAVPPWRRPSLWVWAVLTADLARRRIQPGPRGAREVATMALTSVAIPPAATWWWLVGWARLPGQLAQGGPVRL
jgi:glycosyltransferase involved in cell wall biosynthesis